MENELIWSEDGTPSCPCGGEIEFLKELGHTLAMVDGRVIATPRPMDGDSKIYCIDCEQEFSCDIDEVA